MKLSVALSLVALAAAPTLASAAAQFNVDFENTWQYGETVDNHYASSGVSFTNVLGISNDDSFTYYSNAPSPIGVAMAQLDGVVNTSAFMNVAAGVDGALSFSYASPSDVIGAVKAYSGLNGTGTLLGTFDLMANGAAYDVWTPTTFHFAGTAQSFDLTGSANVVGMDNVSAVPEADGLWMALAGLLSFAGSMMARSRRA